jgi:tetratricopeptide (TPR) repeat protein
VALQDDRPINEYYFFREHRSHPVSDANDLNASFRLYQAGRYQEAIMAAKAALKADPSSADAYNNLAVTYAALRMWDDAAQNAQEALRINPNYQLARNNLIWIMQEKQKAPSSPPASSNSPAAQPYVTLSVQFYQAGKFSECITAANQAIKLDPQLAEAYNNLAACYASLRNWDGAIRAANQAVLLKPDFQLAKNNLAWALQQKGLAATAPRPR